MMSIPISGGQPGASNGGRVVPEPSVRADVTTRVAPRAGQPGGEVQRGDRSAEVRRDEVDVAVQSLNDFVSSVQRDIRFRVDDVTGEAIVQVIDRESDTVVRQIPSEVALQLARRLREHESVNLLHATG